MLNRNFGFWGHAARVALSLKYWSAAGFTDTELRCFDGINGCKYEEVYSAARSAVGPKQKSRGPRAMSALQVIAAEIFEKTEVADSISAYPP